MVSSTLLLVLILKERENVGSVLLISHSDKVGKLIDSIRPARESANWKFENNSYLAPIAVYYMLAWRPAKSVVK